MFRNRRLLEPFLEALASSCLGVLVPAVLPTNDGGISLGQAIAAAAFSRKGKGSDPS